MHGRSRSLGEVEDGKWPVHGPAGPSGRLGDVGASGQAQEQQYPTVEAILRDRAAGLLTPPAATVPVIPPRDTKQNPAPEVSAHMALVPGSPAAPNAPPTPTAPTEHKWTPELRIQAFKEGVTALIGMLLVAFIVYLAVRTLDVAGNRAKTADSQVVLTVMLGLAGVVLGY